MCLDDEVFVAALAEHRFVDSLVGLISPEDMYSLKLPMEERWYRLGDGFED